MILGSPQANPLNVALQSQYENKCLAVANTTSNKQFIKKEANFTIVVNHNWIIQISNYCFYQPLKPCIITKECYLELYIISKLVQSCIFIY